MTPPGNPYLKQLDDISMLWRQKGKAQHIYGIERLILIGLAVFLMAMPTMALRWFAGRFGLRRRKNAIEVYAVLKPVLLIFVLWSGLAMRGWVCGLAILFVFDLYGYLLGILLLRGFWAQPVSYSRSLILLAFNLVEFVAVFAIFYIYVGCLTSSGTAVTGWSNAFYFSAVTSATVGYGDISPAPGLGRFLVTIQIFGSLGFMAMIVAHFVSNIERDRIPIQDD